MTGNDKLEAAIRLRDAAIAALRGGGGELNIVLLVKALFFADLLALRDLGAPMTRTAYMGLAQGPVLAKYRQRLVAPLVNANLAVEKRVGHAKPLALTAVGESEAPALLTAREVARARATGEFFGNMTSTDASHYSHLNPGWIAAEAKRLASPNGKVSQINMMLALQDPRLYSDDDDAECDALLGVAFDESEAQEPAKVMRERGL